jgi:hypothetical protein
MIINEHNGYKLNYIKKEGKADNILNRIDAYYVSGIMKNCWKNNLNLS